MSGRDFGRGGRGFGDRDRRGFEDQQNEGRGGFRDRGREGAGQSRPWERRDDERPPRTLGDRPFDRPEGERDVRVERYDEPARPPRPWERPEGDRPARFDRDGGGDRFRRDSPPPAGRPAPAAPPARPAPPSAPAPTPAPPAAPTAQRGWTPSHLIDSWHDEERLKWWTPSDQELQDLVEDHIEEDPQVPGRDFRAITVRARDGVVALTGAVRSRAVKFAAGNDAYWTYGVREVRNELTLKPRGQQVTADQPATATAAVEATETAAPKRVSRRKAVEAEAAPEESTVPATVEGQVDLEARPEAEASGEGSDE